MRLQEGRKKKSVSLTDEEYKRLKQYRKTFRFEIDCAEDMGIIRETFGRLLSVGSASPETIEKVRSRFDQLDKMLE